MVAALAVILFLSPVPAAAHEDYRVIGTITKVTEKTLVVKQSKDGKIISMKVDPEEILVTRDKKRVETSELKVGRSVVVDARGDSLKDLLVLEVKLVAPAAKK
jgi:hypothetical protein